MMNNEAEVSVTLTSDLYERLRTEARALGVSLEWLVASLVVDTIESNFVKPALA